MVQLKLPATFPDRDNVIQMLGPYPVFKLKANVRKFPGYEGYEIDDITPLIGCPNTFDCIDTCLNMLCRLKQNLKNTLKDPVIVRTVVECRLENGEKWSDMYSDEFHLNCPGMTETPLCETKCA
jgi:hypothetical protein